MLRSLVKSAIPPPMRFALRQLALEVKIARLHKTYSQKARRYRADHGALKVNLASGARPKAGWINVDLFEPTADLRLDLRRPLPFSDDSIAHIYAEHFFEHLEYPNVLDSTGWGLESAGTPSEARQFLRECRRVLIPGGALDIVVPDAEGMIAEYVKRREAPVPEHEWWGPKWCDNSLHRLNYLFRQGREHKYAYDDETLS